MESFQFSMARFYLAPSESTMLFQGEHIGALLRDRFGSALRYVACQSRPRICAATCDAPSECAYTRLFSPTAQSDGRLDGDVYRPYVIEPPVQYQREFGAEECLAFNLLLVGRAMKEFPVFVSAFAEMARHGFGDGMKPWRLDRVVNIADSNAKDGTILWAKDCFFADLKCKDFAGVCSDAEELSPQSVTLQFTTPLCLEQRGRLVEEVNSEALCRAILRRVSRLALLWCGLEWDMDYGAEIAFWRERIRCERAHLQVVEWRRYSARQGQSMPLKGFQGSLRLEGDLEKVRYLLKLGEFLHIGRHSVFGLGKYQCIGKA